MSTGMNTRGPKPDQNVDEIVQFLREVKGKTFQQIGSTLGVSKERAWARYDRIVNKKDK